NGTYDSNGEESWISKVESFLDKTPESPLRQHAVQSFLLAQGKPDEALAGLQNYLEATPDVTGMLPNALLWSTLLYEDSVEVLRHRTELVEEMIGKGAASQHTLACAYAVLGRIQDAADINRGILARAYNRQDGSIDLLRGLVALNLGLDGVAKDCLDAVVQKNPRSEGSSIARKYRTEIKDRPLQ
ncbi:MAG: hypothetical protein AAF989_11935, partial [Planctomycetota bacterium]